MQEGEAEKKSFFLERTEGKYPKYFSKIIINFKLKWDGEEGGGAIKNKNKKVKIFKFRYTPRRKKSKKNSANRK